jgi:hypothetical protein
VQAFLVVRPAPRVRLVYLKVAQQRIDMLQSDESSLHG